MAKKEPAWVTKERNTVPSKFNTVDNLADAVKKKKSYNEMYRSEFKESVKKGQLNQQAIDANLAYERPTPKMIKAGVEKYKITASTVDEHIKDLKASDDFIPKSQKKGKK